MTVMFLKTFRTDVRSIFDKMASSESFRVTGDCNSRRLRAQIKD